MLVGPMYGLAVNVLAARAARAAPRPRPSCAPTNTRAAARGSVAAPSHALPPIRVILSVKSGSSNDTGPLKWEVTGAAASTADRTAVAERVDPYESTVALHVVSLPSAATLAAAPEARASAIASGTVAPAPQGMVMACA